MTKKQRERVVELLRCAADRLALNTHTVWFDTVAMMLDADEQTTELARRATIRVQEEPHFDRERIEATQRGLSVMPNEWGVRVALEAAQRVEEGNWP